MLLRFQIETDKAKPLRCDTTMYFAWNIRPIQLIRAGFACALVALPFADLSAEEVPTGPPSVLFGRYPLAMQRTSITSSAGTPADKATLDSPFPDDFPPHTEILFEDTREYPAFKKGARYFIKASNSLTVYRISEVEKAPYKTIQADIKRMKQLLKERPKRRPHDENERTLPEYPLRNASHAFDAKVQYLDVPWGSGILCLTQFSQEVHLNFANNEELIYFFQGISKDGKFYVDVEIRVTHPKLPAGIDSKPAKVGKKQKPDDEFLNAQADDSFTPSLKKVREWIGTFEFK